MEALARRAGIIADTGIMTWSGTNVRSFDPAAELELLKLHDSVNWIEQRTEGPVDEMLVVETEEPKSAKPAVIFGQRGKLRPDGPFVPMLLQLMS